MHSRKGFRFLFRGLLLALVLSVGVGFFVFSPLHPTHAATQPSWPLIGSGDRGEDVFSVQLMLQARGFSLSIDGVDGMQTTGAVVSFQSAHSLQADGVVGPQTWPALIVTTSQGNTGSAVQALQRQLNAHGASLTVDGNFGPATTTAVKNFQSSHNLSADGIAGPQTWNALVGVGGAQTFTWPDVGQGASGENVFSIQLMLQAHGTSLSIDGSFGSQTASTVKAFQSAHSLSADGVVGPQTWPVLIITTSQGNTGSAVQALQRQLNAHGASLTVDGNFGPATTTAVKNYQSSHNLGVDGIAGLQTWSSLVSTAGTPPSPPPPPPPPGQLLWGVDTTSFVTSSFLSEVGNNFGTPQFIGRYIDALSFSPISASEASFIHSKGIHILPILSDFGGDTGLNTGVSRANDAIAKAHALSIPKGTILVVDIEAGEAVDAGYVEGWNNTIAAAGYVVGYYENPLPGSSQFNSAFCTAVGSDSGVANAMLFSSEPSLGRTPASSKPPFGPDGLLCNGQDRGGHTLIWQYGLQGHGAVNIDTDELQSSVPLW
ncbi:MAG TPA: peptidoglycan-binding protein [Ktedonobacteraceae bacterium]|nr:peptidoglycan-binding protein [Ktedonobacteraceae bacterium]